MCQAANKKKTLNKLHRCFTSWRQLLKVYLKKNPTTWLLSFLVILINYRRGKKLTTLVLSVIHFQFHSSLVIIFKYHEKNSFTNVFFLLFFFLLYFLFSCRPLLVRQTCLSLCRHVVWILSNSVSGQREHGGGRKISVSTEDQPAQSVCFVFRFLGVWGRWALSFQFAGKVRAAALHSGRR